MAESTPSRWLQLYFVLAALLGLMLTAIGASMLVNTYLNDTILKVEQRGFVPPPQPAIEMSKLEDQKDLTAEQKQALEQWQTEYKQWQESEKNRDYEAENRKRTYASAISFLVVGIPILLIHAPWIWRKSR